MFTSNYGTSKTYRDGRTYGYVVHLEPCKNAPEVGWVTFEYDDGGGFYRYWLLSECNDLAQKRIKRLLNEDGVKMKVVDHYYTVVTSELYKED